LESRRELGCLKNTSNHKQRGMTIKKTPGKEGNWRLIGSRARRMLAWTGLAYGIKKGGFRGMKFENKKSSQLRDLGG